MRRKPCARAARSGRRGDVRQAGGFRGRRPQPAAGYSDRAPGSRERREERNPSGKARLETQRGPEGRGSPKRSASGARNPSDTNERSEKPEWRAERIVQARRQKFGRSRGSRRSAKREGAPEWKPKGSFEPRTGRPNLTGSQNRTEARRPLAREVASSSGRPRRESSLEARPRIPDRREKRKWVPKAEYKKSLGIEAKKDKNWRPGGEHRIRVRNTRTPRRRSGDASSRPSASAGNRSRRKKKDDE